MALLEVHRCYCVVIIILDPEENQQIGIVRPSAQVRKLRLSLAQCAAQDQVVGRQAAPPRLWPEETEWRGRRSWVGFRVSLVGEEEDEVERDGACGPHASQVPEI